MKQELTDITRREHVQPQHTQSTYTSNRTTLRLTLCCQETRHTSMPYVTDRHHFLFPTSYGQRVTKLSLSGDNCRHYNALRASDTGINLCLWLTFSSYELVYGLRHVVVWCNACGEQKSLLITSRQDCDHFILFTQRELIQNEANSNPRSRDPDPIVGRTASRGSVGSE